MDLANLQNNLPVLIVVLLTWGGLFMYLVRVERMTREVERRITETNNEERTKIQETQDLL